MVVTLKNVKTHERNSQETLCFSASLYVDGKRVGEVRNHGDGGSHVYDFTSPDTRARFREVAAAYGEKNEIGYGADDSLVNGALRNFENQAIARKNRRNGFPVTILGKKKKVAYGTGPRDFYWETEELVACRSDADAQDFIRGGRYDEHEIITT